MNRGQGVSRLDAEHDFSPRNRPSRMEVYGEGSTAGENRAQRQDAGSVFTFGKKQASSRVSRGRSGGYTIVETMIFLAVSGAMFVMVMLLVGGKQGKTEFEQAVGDYVSSLQDTANDVSTGFANYEPNGCVVTGGHVVNETRSDPLAGEQRCIFIGRVIQFAPSGSNAQSYQVYGVVGDQFDPATGSTPVSIATAHPTALAPGTGASASNVDHSSLSQFGYGATVTSVTYNNGAGNQNIGAFGFFTTFQSLYNLSNNTFNSGAVHVDIYPIVSSPAVNLGTSSASAVNAMNNTASYAISNPSQGITVCLASASSNQIGIVKIGGNNGELSVTSSIQAAGTPCP